MAINPFRVNGLGILKGFTSDSNYTSTTGSTPVQGDIYYNTFLSTFRYFDGTNWRNSTQATARISTTYVDTVSTSLPSTGSPYTPDGTAVITGDTVLFINPAITGIYEFTVVSGNVTAITKLMELQDPINGIPVGGDEVYIRDGSTNAESTWLYNGTFWTEGGSLVGSGTTLGSILVWSGSQWIEDPSVTISSTTLTGPTSITPTATTVSSPSTGTNLAISGGANTGTGNGGALNLNGGTSSGGLQGNVNLSGYLIWLDAPLSADPGSGVAGQIYYNTTSNVFRYYNGSAWTTMGGSGANTSLSNLSSVAINTSLLPGVDNSISLGTPTSSWSSANIHNLLDGSGINSVNPYARTLTDTTNTAQLSWSTSGVTVATQLNLGSLEQTILSSAAIADNQVSPATLFTYLTSFNFAIIEYSISRNGSYRTARMQIATDGTNVNFSEDYSELGTTGVTISVSISGSNVQIQYVSTSTGFTGTFKHSMRQWN